MAPLRFRGSHIGHLVKSGYLKSRNARRVHFRYVEKQKSYKDRDMIGGITRSLDVIHATQILRRNFLVDARFLAASSKTLCCFGIVTAFPSTAKDSRKIIHAKAEIENVGLTTGRLLRRTKWTANSSRIKGSGVGSG